MHRRRPLLPRALLLASIALAPLAASLPGVAAAQPAAAPQKRDEAVSRYQKGVEFFQEGDFQASLIEFKRSYELVPNFNVLFNIGQVYYQLQDYANALKTLEQYLEDGAKRIPATRRAEVEKDVEKLRARVAQVTIKVNVPGAEVLIDDVVVGTSPLSGPITVSAGRRRFAAQKDGAGARTTEDIAGNDQREIVLELAQGVSAVGGEGGGDKGGGAGGAAASAGAGAQGGSGATTEPESDFPVVPVVAWSLTGALAITTGVFGALALSADSDLATLKTQPGQGEPALQDAADRAGTMALVSDVFLVATIVGAGVATTFTILEITSDDGRPADAASARLFVTPGFVGLGGRF